MCWNLPFRLMLQWNKLCWTTLKIAYVYIITVYIYYKWSFTTFIVIVPTWRRIKPENSCQEIFRFAAVSVLLEVRKHKPALVHAVLLSVGNLNLPGVAERIIIIAGWMSPLIARGQHSRGTLFCNKILITLGFWSGIKVTDASQELMSHAMETRALERVII